MHLCFSLQSNSMMALASPRVPIWRSHIQTLLLLREVVGVWEAGCCTPLHSDILPCHVFFAPLLTRNRYSRDFQNVTLCDKFYVAATTNSCSAHIQFTYFFWWYIFLKYVVNNFCWGHKFNKLKFSIIHQLFIFH